ncbi:MAG: DNA polymerase III subunit gamma/tau, partial [Janthinobacterium lividum]
MAYQVLARKYRPLRFSDVVGQDHVTRTLLNALAQDRIAHGYIFSGHRGIGKTTIARILASALNCQREIGSPDRPTPEPCLTCDSCLEIRAGNSVDMLEIDAATNRGIDEIRELRDAARYRPARDRFKIILLDEAHQITDAAFNALLKTLEEPPEHIVFMMATTQPEDIPQTIRSRCQHFSFHAVKLDDIVGQLRKISTDENIDVDDATLGLLAEAGDGSMRDALSIMDQAIASAPQEANGRPHVELAEVRSLMGAVSNVVFEEILAAVYSNDSATVLHVLGGLLDAGNGAQQIARQFVRFLRNCVVAKITALGPEADATGIAAELLQISVEERRRAARAAAGFSEEELSRFLSILLRTFDDLGYRQEQRLHLELGLLKLVHVQRLVPVEELLSQLGVGPSSVAPAKPSSSPPPHRPPATSSTPPLASTRPVLNTAPAASAPETSLPRPIATRLPSTTAPKVAPSTPAQPPAPGPLAPPPQVALPVAKSAPTRTV